MDTEIARHTKGVTKTPFLPLTKDALKTDYETQKARAYADRVCT